MSSSQEPKPLADTFKLADVLAAVGTRLPNASDSLCLEEAISSLDVVRRDALIGKTDHIGKPVPVLLSDTLEASSFLPHEQNPEKQEDFRKGSFNLHKQKLALYGGCIIDQGSGPAAVNIFYSESKQVLMLHVPNADIAGIEANFYDAAFKEGDSWESYVKGAEGGEMRMWRREAAVASRNIGADKLDAMFFDDSNYYVLRYGVIPFLALRHPETAKENKMVSQALSKVQRVVSAAGKDKSLTSELPKMKNVCIATVFESGHPVAAKEFMPEAPDKIQENTTAMVQRPILAALSMMLLQSAADSALDDNGEALSEYTWALPPHIDHQSVLRDVGATEKSYLMAAKHKTGTEMEMSQDKPFCLPTLMKGMGGRRHTVKLLVDGDECSTAEMMDIVTSQLFTTEDAKLVSAHAWGSISPTMTVVTALTALAKCIDDHQAIIIASRDPDGRFNQVRMICRDKSIMRMSMDGVRRAMLFPWAVFLIVEKKRVYQLSIWEPEDIKRSPAFEQLRRGPIQLREGVKESQNAAIEKKEIADLRKDVAALDATVKEFERKINYLIEKKVEETTAAALQPQNQPPPPPPPPAPPRPRRLPRPRAPTPSPSRLPTPYSH